MNSSGKALTAAQQTILTVLRFAIGWHLFYQGFGKLQAVSWSAEGYLQASTGPFSFLFQAIAQSRILVACVDATTMWGLMVLGLFLMVGLFSQTSALGGFALLMLFYLAHPPLASEGFIIETPEGTELYVNKTLLEALSLLVLIAFPTGRVAGLDILVEQWKEGRQEAQE